MNSYDWNAYEADAEKVGALMGEMEPVFVGYSRMVIVLACTRTIAAMFAPALPETREGYLRRLPDYMHAMWKMMDVIGK